MQNFLFILAYLLEAAIFQPSCPNSYAASSSYEEALMAKTQELKLAEDPRWRALLYIAPKWFSANTSLIDSKPFFLSKDGKSDPYAELSATLRAFFWSAEKKGGLFRHPQCAFPARLKFLDEKLQLDFTQIKKIPCPELDKWLVENNAGKVSLVFSSNFVNNPASMFGHTFLRFHRKENGPFRSALLDPAVNFAAYPDTSNPLLYIIKGLSGRFPGRFDLMPYYLKVQQYNNFESRDLWEYELNFSSDQVHWLLLSLWEVGPHFADYYYFDDNCSYIILVFLNIADPSRKLPDPFHSWIVPSDTVRVVHSLPGLVKKIHYRPSALSRFSARFKDLDDAGKNHFFLIVQDEEGKNLSSLLSGLSPEAKAAPIDTALEYLDFKEKISNLKKANMFGTLRTALFKNRALINAPTRESTFSSEHERPDRGHFAMRLGLSEGYNVNDGNFIEFHFRPALHDLGSSSLGYSDKLQISFFEMHTRYSWKRGQLLLSKLELLEILSLSPLRPLLSPFSWRFSLGYETEPPASTADGKILRKYRMLGGPGLSVQAFGQSLTLYFFGLADMGFWNETGNSFYAGPGLELGFVWAFNDKLRWTASSRYLRLFSGQNRSLWSWHSSLNLSLSTQWETRFSFKHLSPSQELCLMLFRYF